MKFTRQFDQMDCGPACLRMVAPPPTSAPTSVVTVGPDAASVAGYWPGLL